MTRTVTSGPFPCPDGSPAGPGPGPPADSDGRARNGRTVAPSSVSPIDSVDCPESVRPPAGLRVTDVTHCSGRLARAAAACQ